MKSEYRYLLYINNFIYVCLLISQVMNVLYAKFKARA